jgi:NAD(P)H dehydrogenase (quinone)
MKIGMVIFSHTGNTYSVAQKLKRKLEKEGHKVSLERLKVKGVYKTSMQTVEFDKLPELKKYDGLVMGAPVMAFALCPPMKQYLGRLERLDGKKIACLATQFFPFKWMGGNRAVRRMRKACLAAGGVVLAGGVINWSRRDREQRIEALNEKISACF